MAVLSLKAVAQALDRVESAGQAQAAARTGLAEYDALRPTIGKLLQFAYGPWEGFSWKGLEVAAAKVRAAAKAVQGPPGARLRYKRPDGGPGKSEPSWAALHAALLQLYGEVYAAQVREPGYVGWRDGPGILAQSIVEAPAVFAKGAAKVAKYAGEAASGVAGAAGSVVWAALRPLLPIVGGVLVLALVVGGGVLVFKGKVGA